MDAEREFELACEMRFTAPIAPAAQYYIDPNDFDGEGSLPGVDVLFNDEGEARDAAFHIARFLGKNVTIDVKRDGKYDDTIIVSPQVKVA
ncbi:hypothetical protein [Rhizobium leguminosarum]|uniref:hypothetical protein n=1 Tax=Rhizobium leguminosarum TaxID=384 RepID=UPI001C9468EA|nr:hypothetical protein [Rhizobium leguminosarum]MBY5698439.1 hypothetical protein [Rhizobium leguminosarum]